MAYRLTQEDIDRFGLIDAMAGDEATPADLQKMSMTTGSPADQLVRNSMDYGVPSMPMGEGAVVNQADRILTSPMPSDPVIGSEGITADALTALGIGGNIRLAGQVSPPVTPEKETAVTAPSATMSLLDQSISQDPFENLSKNQRRMLAFAAIKDAGMALQGKEGEAFTGTLAGFRERADMERKRQAASAQRQMLINLYGTSQQSMDSSLLNQMSMTELEKMRENEIKRGMTINPTTGQPLIDPQLTNMKVSQIDRAIEQSKATAGAEKMETFLTPYIDRTLNYLNPNRQLDEKGQPILNPNIANKLSRGYTAFSEPLEYQQFIGDIEVIKSQYTFKNMIDLKKQGVTFGALSEREIEQVSALAGTLDASNPLGTLQTLNQMEELINKEKAAQIGLIYDPETKSFKQGNL